MRLAFQQQLTSGSVRLFPAHLPFDIHYPLWRAVGLAVEPEDRWDINAVKMCQRVITVWSL